MNDQTKGLLITVFGVLCIVPDALFVRLIDASTMTVTMWRNVLCGGVMLIAMLILHRGQTLKAIRAAGKAGLIYAVCAAGASILFVLSVRLTTVANTVFIISSLPVFAAFYSWLLMGERISKRMAWTIGLVMIGLIIIGYGSLGQEGSNIWGDLAALGVAAIFSLGLTVARQKKSVSMVPMAAVAYLACGILLIPFSQPFNVPNDDWIFVILHGGVFIAISTAMLAIGPRYIPSAEVAVIILLESVLAPLLVWFVIGEEPHTSALIGGGLVIGVLFISNLIVLTRKRPQTVQK
ncbi:membrane protein [Amylibacter ulvae]|uniref:Membrane protein n=1 Tax=Paramylibacter ulvae TaxID=1651968 RepID=A0ABQ3D5H2_9RHOB|nr:DMT family transporter [Amylibacter ulvae]GHA59834.1 membrane protein [Amylibacter ulvae]